MSFMASVCSLKLNIIPPNMKFLLKLYREFRFHFFFFYSRSGCSDFSNDEKNVARGWVILFASAFAGLITQVKQAPLWHPTPVLLPGKSHGRRSLVGCSPWGRGIAKSRTQLSDFNFTFHFHALEKEMATHSSILAWRILGTGEPGGLPSMGSHRVGHDWSDLAAAAAEENL